MTRSSSCHLLDILAEVPDPRHKKGKRYTLVSILALLVIGVMSNHNKYLILEFHRFYKNTATNVESRLALKSQMRSATQSAFTLLTPAKIWMPRVRTQTYHIAMGFM